MLAGLICFLLGLRALPRGFSLFELQEITALYIAPMVVDNIFKSNPLFYHLKAMR